MRVMTRDNDRALCTYMQWGEKADSRRMRNGIPKYYLPKQFTAHHQNQTTLMTMNTSTPRCRLRPRSCNGIGSLSWNSQSCRCRGIPQTRLRRPRKVQSSRRNIRTWSSCIDIDVGRVWVLLCWRALVSNVSMHRHQSAVKMPSNYDVVYENYSQK